MLVGKTAFVSFLILAFAGLISAQSDFQKGTLAYEEGSYENAITFFLKAIDQDEESHQAWRFLGITYARLKRYDLANRVFSNSRRLKLYKPAIGDHRNRKIKFLARPRAGYTEVARKNHIKGIVKVAAEFNRNGSVSFIYPYKKLPDGMTERVVEAVRKFRFEPATRDGKKITTIVEIHYRFSLT